MIKWRLDLGQIEVVDDAIAAILRGKTPAERIAMAFDANHTARLVIESAERARHPEWDDRQVKRAVARRMLGGTI